jgi:hypothetical protein
MRKGFGTFDLEQIGEVVDGSGNLAAMGRHLAVHDFRHL